MVVQFAPELVVHIPRYTQYSHYDASLVDPVVKLLRVNNSYVFQDIDYIRPGKKWRSEISKALTDAQLVVVFWCNHARVPL